MAYWFYLPLDSVTDGIEIISQTVGSAQLLIGDVNYFIDNSMPDTYPDFVFVTENNEPECYVNGDPVNAEPLVNGYRPQHRPTPRPR